MKILITGGAGFIGSALVRMALENGHEVINLDALTYAASLGNLSELFSRTNYSFEQIDIRDNAAVTSIFNRYEPDVVMHLAAETHVDRSIQDPLKFVETNIVGTLNLLEAAREYWEDRGFPKNFRFHYISTDEVFGSLGPYGMFTEDSNYNPRSPYSASKASADHLVRAWHATYDLPVILSHCANNYGPFQFPEKLIPLVITNVLRGKGIPIYGDGSHIRDWLHVEDHAAALLLILNKGEIGRSYNVSGQNEWTNLEIVTRICAILDSMVPCHEGNYTKLIKFVADRPGHDTRYATDSSRLRRELGWKPLWEFGEGLEMTVRWYLDNEDWWRPLVDLQNINIGTVSS